MSYEMIEDIIGRLRVVTREISELSRKAKALGSEISNITNNIRYYERLYNITMRNMYTLYGRISWLERRKRYEEAKELRARARMLYSLAQKYRKTVEELRRKVSEIRRELGRIGRRIRELRREKAELEKELTRILKRFPYFKVDIGYYAKYPHVSGRQKIPYRYRRRYIRREKMETWEVWINVAIPSDIIKEMLEDERKRKIIENILYLKALEVIEDHLTEVIENPEFCEALTLRMVRKGIDIVKPLDHEITPELYVEVLERRYRPPKVPLEVEWDNEELRKRIREELGE
ncbi:MAG: hypothetical protein ACTSVA_06520 [Candidatus Njordarchaeales archaeon]